MSNPKVCRECEYNRAEDAVLCNDCAEHGFIELMRTNANKRWDVYTCAYYYSNAAEMDKHSDEILEAWVERNPEKAGKLLFKLFDQALENYQFEGEL